MPAAAQTFVGCRQGMGHSEAVCTVVVGSGSPCHSDLYSSVRVKTITVGQHMASQDADRPATWKSHGAVPSKDGLVRPIRQNDSTTSTPVHP